MARGPFWLCTEIRKIRANLHKTDREIAEMFPGRNEKSISDIRARAGLRKRKVSGNVRRIHQSHRVEAAI